MALKWKLKSIEVYSYGGISTSVKRKNSRQPRNIDERTLSLNLVHKLTNIEVQGVVTGNFYREEMTEKKKELYAQLFKELEEKVAKHLKISGR